MSNNYAIERFKALFPGMPEEIVREDAIDEVFISLYNEARDNDKIETMFKGVLREDVVAVVSKALTSKAKTGGRMMVKKIINPTVTFEWNDMYDALIVTGDGESDYIRFEAAKMRHLEAYRQRQSDNIEKQLLAYEEYLIFYKLMQGYMEEDDLTMGEAVVLMGKITKEDAA